MEVDDNKQCNEVARALAAASSCLLELDMDHYDEEDDSTNPPPQSYLLIKFRHHLL